ncbi:MAG TPA: acetylglutamate kinase [Fibrobacteraceae bacterium]|nr:acetylglutamate kinase [Fibrobacteraceae bacterium]
MQTVVVKIGGSLAVDETKLTDFISAVAKVPRQDFQVVVVHGGGKDINENIALLQEKPHFIEGLRVTTPGIMKMVEMTLSGHVNKKIVRMLLEQGVRAVGISGVDGQLLVATQMQGKTDLGQVGSIQKVNTGLVTDLLKMGWTPVVSPVAFGVNCAFNINADTAASELATAMQADQFLLISDVPGVLDGAKQVIPVLGKVKIEHLISEGVISGGMIPKVRASLDSISRGLRSIHIVGWKDATHFMQQITGEANHGTIIRQID